MQNQKAIIYGRVSTENQDYTRQLNDLKEYAKACNYEIVQIFTDIVSGTTKASKRKGSKAMLDFLENKKNKIDIVLVSEISRLGRSAIDVQNNIDKIVYKNNINLFIRQQGLQAFIDGKLNPTFKLVTDVLANVAQIENEIRSERIKSGLKQAKRNGKVLGRKKGSKQSNETILGKHKGIVKLIKQGNLSLRQMAKISNVSVNTVVKVRNAYNEMKQAS